MANIPYIIVQLIHIQGGLKGEIQEFPDNEISIGRHPSCTVTFPADEPGVSREHARIEREGNQYKLIDLSKFGTSVNGKPVKEAFLRNGDVVEFGPGGPKVSFNMEISAAPAQSSIAPVQAQPIAPVRMQPSAPIQVQPVVQPVVMYDPAPPVAEPPRYIPPPVREEISSFAQHNVAAPAIPVSPPVQKTNAPLIIQYGPMIKTYRELPVMVGADNRADFVLREPGISDQHAQIFFHQNLYWIKDLTGQSLISVNNRPIGSQVQLNENDAIEFCPRGPKVRYLGEGRIAEIESLNEQPVQGVNNSSGFAVDTAGTNDERNVLSRLLKGFRK
jgi:pSer/pThr/pTyr-binding forkhead associated (FHA) protein